MLVNMFDSSRSELQDSSEVLLQTGKQDNFDDTKWFGKSEFLPALLTLKSIQL